MKATFRRAYEVKKPKFNPDRNFINRAMSEYLSRGGMITQLEFDDSGYRSFLNTSATYDEIDEFLGMVA